MKSKKWILSGLLCALLLNGCAASEQNDAKDETLSQQESSSEMQNYREVILQLQQQLESMRETQIQQSEAYEKQIEQLEAVITELEAANPPKNEASNSNGNNETRSLYTYTATENGVIIKSYLGKETTVQIPSTVDGLPVIGIGEGAFRNSSVEQVIIPSGVETIDWFAFYGSYRLQSVVIPASVGVIEYGAFDLCSSALKFTCASGSYAAQYAASYGIPVVAATS